MKLKSRKKKILPVELHVLDAFVNDEIDKETLIHRISGHVDRSILFFVKCLQFYRIGREDGRLFII